MCQHLVIDSHDEHECINCCMCRRKKTYWVRNGIFDFILKETPGFVKKTFWVRNGIFDFILKETPGFVKKMYWVRN